MCLEYGDSITESPELHQTVDAFQRCDQESVCKQLQIKSAESEWVGSQCFLFCIFINWFLE